MLLWKLSTSVIASGQRVGHAMTHHAHEVSRVKQLQSRVVVLFSRMVRLLKYSDAIFYDENPNRK